MEGNIFPTINNTVIDVLVEVRCSRNGREGEQERMLSLAELNVQGLGMGGISTDGGELTHWWRAGSKSDRADEFDFVL